MSIPPPRRPTQKVAALILAAGKGERLGGPKALLLIDGAPLLLAHVAARTADCDRVVVVVRRDVAELLAPVVMRASGGAVVVVSDEPDALGPAGSIRAAMRDPLAFRGIARVVVSPVDALPARDRTVRRLLAPLDAGFHAARFEHGHPVACTVALLAEHYLQELSPPPPLRDVLTALGDATKKLPVPDDDPNVTTELDELADVQRATGAPPRFWSPT